MLQIFELAFRFVKFSISNTGADHINRIYNFCPQITSLAMNGGGLGGVVVIDAAFGAHGKSRPRFQPATLLHRCSDLGQVVNLSLSVA